MESFATIGWDADGSRDRLARFNEKLLKENTDSEEMAKERKDLIIDPILKGIRI